MKNLDMLLVWFGDTPAHDKHGDVLLYQHAAPCAFNVRASPVGWGV